VTGTAASLDSDAERLLELGYEQELERRLEILDNFALAFAGISPVVGLYAVVLVGTVVAGPAWVWVLPVALAGQCLLLAVYGELASEFPMALTLLGIEPTANAIVVTGAVFVVVCSAAGALGIGLLGRVVKAGIAAETVASVGIGLALLLVFREQDLSILTDTMGAEALSGGSVFAALLAALAVGGWVFIGFDVGVGASEETRNAARHVPRAIWIALLTVGCLVILNAVAAELAHPDPASVVAGSDLDPVTTAVVTSFGSWSAKPFAAVVLVAFLACGMAAQALTARTMFSLGRDGVLPASSFLRTVDRRKAPIGAIVVTTVVGCLGLLLGLNSNAVGSLIAFGTAAIYVSFLMTASAALIARLRGSWRPAGQVRIGRAGTIVNVLAVAWLAFETVNIAWPREALAPPDAPFYQVWAAPIVLGVIAVLGVAYLVVARPIAE
jgi:amino acid transporter